MLLVLKVCTTSWTPDICLLSELGVRGVQRLKPYPQQMPAARNSAAGRHDGSTRFKKRMNAREAQARTALRQRQSWAVVTPRCGTRARWAVGQGPISALVPVYHHQGNWRHGKARLQFCLRRLCAVSLRLRAWRSGRPTAHKIL